MQINAWSWDSQHKGLSVDLHEMKINAWSWDSQHKGLSVDLHEMQINAWSRDSQHKGLSVDLHEMQINAWSRDSQYKGLSVQIEINFNPICFVYKSMLKFLCGIWKATSLLKKNLQKLHFHYFKLLLLYL